MGLLQSKTSGGKRKKLFIGTYTDKETSDYLSIYCTALGESKSKVIKDALAKELIVMKEEYPLDTLLMMLVRLAKQAKKDINSNDVDKLATFEADLEDELRSKNIPVGTIEYVLEQVNEEDKPHGKKKKRKKQK